MGEEAAWERAIAIDNLNDGTTIAPVPGIARIHGHTLNGSKIAITGAVTNADDICITIGSHAMFTATNNPDFVRLNADGTFVFLSGSSLPTGTYTYKMCAIKGAIESAAEVGTVEITAQARPNLLANPGFEMEDDDGAVGWRPFDGTWGTTVQRERAAARNGSYGVSITTSTTNNPSVIQQVYHVEEGALYELTVWTKAVDIQTGSPGFKFEFYSSETASQESWINCFFHHRLRADSLTGDWQQIEYRFVIPAKAKVMECLLRFYGTGTVYFDDAELRKVRDPVQTLRLNTDRLFYRPEQTQGTIMAFVAPKDETFTEKTIDLWLYNQESRETLLEHTGIGAASRVEVGFDPSAMELRIPYRLFSIVRDRSGQVLASSELELYRWQRPTALAENGTLLVDGKPFYPVYMYHVPIADYSQMAAIGINAVQGNTVRTLAQMKEQLDAAEAHNLKMLVTLYKDSLVRQNLPFTEQVVSHFKDHPAVLAWYVYDEPNEHGLEFQELVEAYKLIRSIDDQHPVFIMESKSAYSAETSKVCDVLGIDVYPLPIRSIARVGERLVEARQATDEQLPVWQALQAFRLPNSKRWFYLPTITEIRNMAYQTLLNGASGIAYYSFFDPGWRLDESELWPGMQQFANEYALLRHLTLNAVKLDFGRSKDVQWGLWQSNEVLYAVAVHTGDEPQHWTLPLSLTDYRIELVAASTGVEPGELSSVDVAMPFWIEGGQSNVYKATPPATTVHLQQDRDLTNMN